MPYTELQQRVEQLMADTNCSRELAQQAVIANYPQPGRSETKEERILRRAVGIMRYRRIGWSRAIDIAAQSVD